MAITEEQVINAIAKHERAINGVKHSYNYASNPDNLSGQTPCVLHIIPRFETSPRAHHNVWTSTLDVTSILFVAERTSKGGTLKFLENTALRFGALWREKFQTESVINDLFASTSNTVRVFLREGTYGAGGNLLTHNGVEYIGWVFRFEFKEN